MVAIKEVNENELSENGASPAASPGPHVGALPLSSSFNYSCYFPAGGGRAPGKKGWASDVSQAKTFHTGISQQTDFFHAILDLKKSQRL